MFILIVVGFCLSLTGVVPRPPFFRFLLLNIICVTTKHSWIFMVLSCRNQLLTLPLDVHDIILSFVGFNLRLTIEGEVRHFKRVGLFSSQVCVVFARVYRQRLTNIVSMHTPVKYECGVETIHVGLRSSLSSRAMSDYVDTMNFLSRISANLTLLVISFPCLQFEFTNHEVWRIFQKAYTQIYLCAIVEQIKHWLHAYIASVGGQRTCIRLIFPQGVCASVPRPRVKYVLFQRVPLNLVYMVHTILQEYAVDLSLQYQCVRIGSSEILRMLGCI